MAGDSGNRIKHFARVIRAGFPDIWWIAGSIILVVVGGSVWLTVKWGFIHRPWGLVLLLAVLLAVALEGSWRIESAHRSALKDEQAAHAATKDALRIERQHPVSDAHRDRLKAIAQRQETEISGGYECRYYDLDDPHADTRAMLESHFPDVMALLDSWDAAVAERHAAATGFLIMVHKFISEHLSSAPWKPDNILDAFRERVDRCSQVTGPDIPEFTVNFKDETGLWQITQREPLGAILSFKIFNSEEAGERAAHYRRLFETAFQQICTSPEFGRLRMAWQTVRDLRQPALDAMWKIDQQDKIYGRCCACGHALSADMESPARVDG
jgi:hypothetical protein